MKRQCEFCEGEAWVCKVHIGKPWGGPNHRCNGEGVPCICNELHDRYHKPRPKAEPSHGQDSRLREDAIHLNINERVKCNAQGWVLQHTLNPKDVTCRQCKKIYQRGLQ